MSEQFETAIERIKRDYALTAAEMRCPYHQKNARVEVAIGRLDLLYIDIFTCCEEFERRVRRALYAPHSQRKE